MTGQSIAPQDAPSQDVYADAKPQDPDAQGVETGAVEPGKPRRALRAALRWTSAVLVFGVLGGGVAYGVAQPERTRIPGLETPDDGRWEYQPLALPKLPAGKPSALDTVGNPGGRHYADARSLLLPAPEGAKPDPAYPGAKGWLPVDTYLRLFAKDVQAAQRGFLTKEGLRHIAARAWTMPDGTRAETYLLQFSTAPHSERYRTDVNITPLARATEVEGDLDSQLAGIDAGPVVYPFEGQGANKISVRYAYIAAGDTLGVVVLSHAGAVPAVLFRQTVTLQAQLLG